MEAFWTAKARELQRRMNFYSVFNIFAPSIGGYFLFLLPAQLFLRRSGYFHQETFLVACFLGAMFLLSLSYVFARSNFISRNQAFVLLEDELGLETRLSAAKESFIDWPEPREYRLRFDYPYHQRLPFPIATMLSFALSIIMLKPLPTESKRVRAVPPALNESQQLFESLAESELLSEEVQANLEERLRELMRSPESDWYSPGMLEATESLEEELETSIKELAETLKASEEILSELSASEGSDSENLALREALEAKVDQLQENRLQANADIARSLSEAAKSADSEFQEQLAESLRELREELQGGSSSERSRSGTSERQGAASEAERGQQPQAGSSEETERTCTGQGAGAGQCGAEESRSAGAGSGRESSGNSENAAAGRGGGEAPLELKEKSPQLSSHVTQRLESEVGDDSEPGELIGLEARVPEIAQSQNASEAAVRKRSRESGIARERMFLEPGEKEVVDGFFR